MKNRILCWLASVMCLLAFGMLLSASAEVVKPNDDFWYLDESGVLSEATEGEIFFANQRLYDACGAEIVVAAIDTTGSMAIDEYAYTLFNEWEIGGSSYRGLLLLMAIEDDNYYVMPGTAMSAYFDSATVSEMMDKYLEPDFARKDYDRGAKVFFEAAYEKVVDDFNLNLSIKDAVADYTAFVKENSVQGAHTQVQQNGHWREPVRRGSSSGAIVLIVVLLILVFITTRRFRRNPRVHAAPPPRVHMRSRSNHFSSAAAGYMLGRMMSSARRRHPGPPSGPGGRPPMGGFGGGSSVNRVFGGNSFRSGSSHGSFGSGFGGASRSGTGRSSFGGGFGGASRSGGASRGPSTRGGGAGRFSRK